MHVAYDSNMLNMAAWRKVSELRRFRNPPEQLIERVMKDIAFIDLEYDKPVHKNKKRFEQEKKEAYGRLSSYVDEMIFPSSVRFAGF